MNEIASDNSVLHPMIAEIKDVIDKAKAHIAHQVNSELLYAYWNIGRIMVENEQSQPERADYGKQTIRALSEVLTRELGKGILCFQSAIHAAVLSHLSDSTDSVC